MHPEERQTVDMTYILMGPHLPQESMGLRWIYPGMCSTMETIGACCSNVWKGPKVSDT